MNTFFSEHGQGLVEYSLILLLVAIVVIVAVTSFGTGVNGLFGNVNSELESMSQLANFI